MAVVVKTGLQTYLGSISSALVGQEVQTSFDKGVTQFTWLMIRFILVMVPLVFVINGLTKHNWQEAFFFAMAVAVGITPEMLPMIVTVCLSKGALAMSRKKVIVKRLNAIQNFGAMDVLCTDKTMMIRFILVMVPLVFVINGLTKHNWQEAFFFAMAVAVGITPEMLPMIVTVCLSKGALAMSRKKVIVKRLNAIQNFGAMDVLCTDKTGTLTMDRVILEKHCNVIGEDDQSVLVLAYLNSFFQTGLKNVLDRAILEHRLHEDKFNIPNYRKVDEVPFDFSRKLMSVVVETPDGVHRLICKGAPEEVFKRCAQFELKDEFYSMDHLFIGDLQGEYERLSADGFRVLAIASKDLEQKPAYSTDDEANLILKGYVAFLDPPKDSTAPAVLALHTHGVSVKILTGDNELVSKKICREVGIDIDQVLLGTRIEEMSDLRTGRIRGADHLIFPAYPGPQTANYQGASE